MFIVRAYAERYPFWGSRRGALRLGSDDRSRRLTLRDAGRVSGLIRTVRLFVVLIRGTGAGIPDQFPSIGPFARADSGIRHS